MNLKYRFSFEKAVGAMVYLLDRIGDTDKVKLVKLLYIADRNHFVQHGYPITGSRLVAMDKGPLPSECLNLLDGEWSADPTAAFKYVHVYDNRVRVRNSLATDILEESERRVLDQVAESFGDAATWDVVNYTHEFEEYKQTYREGTSTTIPFELLLKVYKPGAGFRHNRAVIPAAALQHIDFPFTAKSDVDL